ncbi:LysR family transcriptional regulator [Halomonas caseinilytica]|uniref:Transcriptional regulator /transcriptional regulator, LysR family n=1 Tax=Halomonas caseinilytica TaxID=438744 RepID=A0A1M6R1T3_9GAMM|nr:LysR family transcriptional regulator [Halomonas caseinilytica]SEM03107.1 DNA-binding transcriptional regulator, LysR family [Halomonas caseinilytica]SHK26402.1 transcriptional regulator /transcriptional regulator, LysR family [Halomonas caseinilytica]
MQQDLNDALIFAKVVEQGSFTAASKLLSIPKTTVSRKIQALELRLGARLLNRTTRRLSLTEAGGVYYDYCHRIVQDLGEAESAVQRLEGNPRGWLRVTAPFTMCTDFTSSLLRDFRALYPEVKIDLVLSNERLDLVAQQIDVALRIGPLPDSSLVARPLARYRSFIYASNRYIARHGEPKEPADLKLHPALAKSTDQRGQRYFWQLHRGAQQQEVELDPVTVANDPFVLRGLLLDGSGLMLTSEAVACLGPDGHQLKRILPEWEGPEVEFNAVFPGGRLISPKVRTFVDFVVERTSLTHMASPTPWMSPARPPEHSPRPATADETA